MAAIRLSLKPEKDKNDEQLIMLTYQDHGDRFRHTTGTKINSKYWDAVKQKVKGTSINSSEINIILDDLKATVNRIVLKAKGEGFHPTVDYIKGQLSAVRLDFKKLDLFEFIEHYISKSKSAPGTKKIYNNTFNHLTGYKNYTKQVLSFGSINLDFYEKFTSYLFDILQLNGNTVGKIIKTLKLFLNNAAEKGLIDKQSFSKFKVITQQPDIIYLTMDEVNTLYNLDLTKKPYLERVRDVFCFSCLTGLRFSDLKALKREQIANSEIHFTTQKTNHTLTIPLTSKPVKILEKYKNDIRPLPVPSNVKMNEYLKTLGKEAKIDTPTVLIKYKGNIRSEVIVPKYLLISTHTGRRTFITLSLEKGIRAEVLMKITGHRTTREFYKYAIITSSVAKQELIKAFD